MLLVLLTCHTPVCTPYDISVARCQGSNSLISRHLPNISGRGLVFNLVWRVGSIEWRCSWAKQQGRAHRVQAHKLQPGHCGSVSWPRRTVPTCSSNVRCYAESRWRWRYLRVFAASLGCLWGLVGTSPMPHRRSHRMMGYAAYCHGENDLENKAAFQTARNVNVGFAGNCI